MIVQSATRLSATLLAIAQTRLRLAATEIEEESVRYFSYLMLSLTAMFFLALAIMLGVLLVVVLYWESHRVGVLAALTLLFSLAGVTLAWLVGRQYRHKPPLLQDTLGELARDKQLLNPQG